MMFLGFSVNCKGATPLPLSSTICLQSLKSRNRLCIWLQKIVAGVSLRVPDCRDVAIRPERSLRALACQGAAISEIPHFRRNDPAVCTGQDCFGRFSPSQ